MSDEIQCAINQDLDEIFDSARKSADAQEGIRAMLEKRKPVFRGE
jgi:enoyl-CoA hydratase/carnithine racemase